MNNNEITNRAQRNAIREIERRDSDIRIIEVVEAGMGHVCVDWVEYDGRQFQVLINEAGQRVGLERQIWC